MILPFLFPITVIVSLLLSRYFLNGEVREIGGKIKYTIVVLMISRPTLIKRFKI